MKPGDSGVDVCGNNTPVDASAVSSVPVGVGVKEDLKAGSAPSDHSPSDEDSEDSDADIQMPKRTS